MGVLVDTSAWVDAFRGSSHSVMKTVDRLLGGGEAVLCGVVEMELRQGMRTAERGKVLPLLEAVPYVEVQRDDWRLAGEEWASLRASGVTIPPSDCLVAAIAMRRELQLLTTDSHFEHFSKKLVLVPFGAATQDRKPGSAKGRISVSEDFDAPLPDELLKGF